MNIKNVIFFIVLSFSSSVFASNLNGLISAPSYQDISYGPHQANKLDIYLSPSSKPTPVLIFIHGGAFAGGDKKKQIRRPLINLCLKNQISVVTINYRLSKDKDYYFKYSPETPLPPAFEDAARAVQFIRYHAAEYNIDKTRLAVSGGSAGAGLSLWLGFHNDLANMSDKDPIKHESTKPACVIAFAAQTTYDQEYISQHLKYNGYTIRWIDHFLQLNTAQLKSPITKQLRKSISPLAQVDVNDRVAVFMVPGNEDEVTADMPQGKFVHNAIFSSELAKKLKSLNLPHEVVLQSEYKSGKRKGTYSLDALHFMQKAFQKN